MRDYLAIACLVLAFGACKKDKPASELAGFRDKMCACKAKSGDRAIRWDCAEGVDAEMTAWDKAHGSKEKSPDDQNAASELLACRSDIKKDFDAMKAEQAGSAAPAGPAGSAAP
jgi:hypothetical protein